MFSLFRPSPAAIDQFIRELANSPLSYDRVGMVGGFTRGFTFDETTMVLGRGERDFDRACRALAAWTHFTLGWLEVLPHGAAITPGTNVAICIRHLGLWSLNGSRVVYSVDDEGGRRRFGFAYGTLARHAERGEELFEITMDPATDVVTYRIRAASRPRSLLAWLGYPVVRRLQARCRRESAEAMRRAVAG